MHAHYLNGQGVIFIPEDRGVHIFDYKGEADGFFSLFGAIGAVNE